MITTTRLLGALACVTTLGLTGPAQAILVVDVPPVVTFSEVAISSSSSLTIYDSNVSYTEAANVYLGSTTSSSTVDTERRVTKPYVVEIYNDATTTVTRTSQYGYQDGLNAHAYTDGPQFAAGQYIQLTGKVTATQDIDLSLNLRTGGSYQSTRSPFGAVIPALPTLFFASDYDPAGDTNYAVLSNTADTDAMNRQFGQLAYRNLFVQAGQTLSFSAVAYAGQDVFIGLFDLTISGVHNVYATRGIDSVSTVSTLVATAPVPEPESYALMLAGLLGLGFLHQRRRRG